MPPELEVSVSDFVALLNQTLEYAYPAVVISGELANLRVSKGKWLYFDLKDELASVKFFGTVYNLPGPLEDGMLLKVRGTPKLHPQYGFSVTVQSIQPAGEGSIRKAAELLAAKLAAEGLFDPARKRPLPYPPTSIGLITSGQSAAYADFTKIINARWAGLTIELLDVQVQGEAAPGQIVAAIEQFNELSIPPEVLVIIRGGGSAEDLAAFSHELVTRAVAASRVPTLVAIGHEVDVSLAELAADQRASTPSNAAELLVPDKRQALQQLQVDRRELVRQLTDCLTAMRQTARQRRSDLQAATERRLALAAERLRLRRQLLDVLDPEAPLRRGYALVYHQGKPLRRDGRLAAGDDIDVQLRKRRLHARITSIDHEQADD